MSVNVIAHRVPELEPIAANPAEYRIAGAALSQWIMKRFPVAVTRNIGVRADFYPSAALAARLFGGICAKVMDPVTGDELVCAGSDCGDDCCTLLPDADSLILRKPLYLLALGERLTASLKEPFVSANVSDAAVIKGVVQIGEESNIPAGVYIEGKVIIGRNCVISSGCRIAGSTVIGDNCVIGEGAEIANSVIGDQAEIAPGCVIRDSVLGSRVVLNEECKKFSGAVIVDDGHNGVPKVIYSGGIRQNQG